MERPENSFVLCCDFSILKFRPSPLEISLVFKMKQIHLLQTYRPMPPKTNKPQEPVLGECGHKEMQFSFFLILKGSSTSSLKKYTRLKIYERTHLIKTTKKRKKKYNHIATSFMSLLITDYFILIKGGEENLLMHTGTERDSCCGYVQV